MKMTRLISFIFGLTTVVFLANGFAENLPVGAIARIDTGQKSVNAIAYSRVANRLAVAAADKIHIYDASTYKELMVFAKHTDSVLAVAFSPNGKFLVSGGSDKTVQLWNTDTGELLRTQKKHTGPVKAIAFTSNGEKFKCGSNEDSAVWYWYPADVHSSGKSGSYMPTDVFTATAFASGSSTEARAFDSASVLDKNIVNFFAESGRNPEASIVLLDLEYSEGGGILSGHADTVNVLTLHVKRQILATGSADKTIQLWNIKDSRNPLHVTKPLHITQPLHILTGHIAQITAMDFSVSGEFLASGSSDKTVRLWDVETGQHRHTFTGHTGEIGAVTFLGDKALAGIGFAEAKKIASGSSNGTVFIWNLDKLVSTD